MAEEKPSIHIDTDWKKQAQEEKRRLAEEEQKKREQQTAAAPARSAPGAAASASAPRGGAAAGGGRAREIPPASFGALVQSILTQVLLYVGDLQMRGSESMVNLDLAKHHVDTLAVLEEKTKGNLTPDEQKLLDAALYESRMRYVAVATQYIAQ